MKVVGVKVRNDDPNTVQIWWSPAQVRYMHAHQDEDPFFKAVIESFSPSMLDLAIGEPIHDLNSYGIVEREDQR